MTVEDVAQCERDAQDERDKAARSADVLAARGHVEAARKFERRARGETTVEAVSGSTQ
jgi:uncharacterized protein with PhoU and TrkA domain